MPGLGITWHAAWWWASRNNTLFANGNWISGKDSGKFVFYSYDFLFRPLRHCCVNLSADMGYQEILYRQPEPAHRRVRALEAKFLLGPGAYLWVEIHKSGLAVLAARISRNSDYPSGFYLFSSSGELASYTPLAASNYQPGDGWHKLKLFREELRLDIVS